ncbi:hypothetical protein RCL1_006589 [Eukaryota sp. TZLM3-RCL]
MDVASLNDRAMALLREDQHSESLDLLLQAEQLCHDPEDVDVLSTFNPVSLATSNGGIERFRLKAITLNNLGCYHKRCQNLQKALFYLKEALIIERLLGSAASNPAGTHLNICSILSEIGDHKTAQNHAKEALKLIRNLPEIEQFLIDVEVDPYTKVPLATPLGGHLQVLVVTYHNLAVEQEFLHHHSSAINSYECAVTFAGFLDGGEELYNEMQNRFESAKNTKCGCKPRKRKALLSKMKGTSLAPCSPYIHSARPVIRKNSAPPRIKSPVYRDASPVLRAISPLVNKCELVRVVSAPPPPPPPVPPVSIPQPPSRPSFFARKSSRKFVDEAKQAMKIFSNLTKQQEISEVQSNLIDGGKALNVEEVQHDFERMSEVNDELVLEESPQVQPYLIEQEESLKVHSNLIEQEETVSKSEFQLIVEQLKLERDDALLKTTQLSQEYNELKSSFNNLSQVAVNYEAEKSRQVEVDLSILMEKSRLIEEKEMIYHDLLSFKLQSNLIAVPLLPFYTSTQEQSFMIALDIYSKILNDHLESQIKKEELVAELSCELEKLKIERNSALELSESVSKQYQELLSTNQILSNDFSSKLLIQSQVAQEKLAEKEMVYYDLYSLRLESECESEFSINSLFDPQWEINSMISMEFYSRLINLTLTTEGSCYDVEARTGVNDELVLEESSKVHSNLIEQEETVSKSEFQLIVEQLKLERDDALLKTTQLSQEYNELKSSFNNLSQVAVNNEVEKSRQVEVDLSILMEKSRLIEEKEMIYHDLLSFKLQSNLIEVPLLPFYTSTQEQSFMIALDIYSKILNDFIETESQKVQHTTELICELEKLKIERNSALELSESVSKQYQELLSTNQILSNDFSSKLLVQSQVAQEKLAEKEMVYYDLYSLKLESEVVPSVASFNSGFNSDWEINSMISMEFYSRLINLTLNAEGSQQFAESTTHVNDELVLEESPEIQSNLIEQEETVSKSEFQLIVEQLKLERDDALLKTTQLSPEYNELKNSFNNLSEVAVNYEVEKSKSKSEMIDFIENSRLIEEKEMIYHELLSFKLQSNLIAVSSLSVFSSNQEQSSPNDLNLASSQPSEPVIPEFKNEDKHTVPNSSVSVELNNQRIPSPQPLEVAANQDQEVTCLSEVTHITEPTQSPPQEDDSLVSEASEHLVLDSEQSCVENQDQIGTKEIVNEVPIITPLCIERIQTQTKSVEAYVDSVQKKVLEISKISPRISVTEPSPSTSFNEDVRTRMLNLAIEQVHKSLTSRKKLMAAIYEG